MENPDDTPITPLQSYRLRFNESEGWLHLHERSYCELDGVTYRIKRQVVKSSGWGYFTFTYTITEPAGIKAWGVVSPHDGIGVWLTSAISWGFDTDPDGNATLGEKTTIRLDRREHRIVVRSDEPAAHVPAVICGVMILADDQNYWESRYQG